MRSVSTRAEFNRASKPLNLLPKVGVPTGWALWRDSESPSLCPFGLVCENRKSPSSDSMTRTEASELRRKPKTNRAKGIDLASVAKEMASARELRRPPGELLRF